MAVYDEGFAPSGGASRTGLFVNYAGAAMSLALIVGISFWGYQLIMRDVSGIPVVRAMEGEMRALPDNPGGDVALHTGLAVNEVAAVGEAGGPEDRLVLAPATPGLAQEDLDVQPRAEAEEVVPEATAEIAQAALTEAVPLQPDTSPLNADEILALADQIAADVAPITQDAAAIDKIARTIPGVATSLRPSIRPASLRVVTPAPARAPAAAVTDEIAVSTETFASGTNLVQLGAFPSPTLAAAEWQSLQGRFATLMGERTRVIQVSNQSDKTWYRLRASGFADRAEARRFCAALEAEGADCIAVTVN